MMETLQERAAQVYPPCCAEEVGPAFHGSAAFSIIHVTQVTALLEPVPPEVPDVAAGTSLRTAHVYRYVPHVGQQRGGGHPQGCRKTFEHVDGD